MKEKIFLAIFVIAFTKTTALPASMIVARDKTCFGYDLTTFIINFVFHY